MSEQAALPAIRSGRWRSVDIGPLGVAAAVSAVSDLVTTYVILATPSHTEANVVLTSLTEVHIGLAMAVFVAFAALLVGSCWLSIGWLSTLAGTYTILSMGSAGLSNAVGFWTGTYLLSVILIPMWVLIHLVIPPLSVVVVAVWLYGVHRQLPWREVAVVFPTVTLGTIWLATVA